MSISDWFKAEKGPAIKPGAKREKSAVPDGIWSKCASCNSVIYQKDLFESYWVCPSCGHHYQLTAAQRLDLLLDKDSFSETEAGLFSKDPLNFRAKKRYRESLDKAIAATGLRDAVVTGKGEIEGREIAIGVMDFRFIGGSMGSVVGEKIVRLVELAISETLPLIIVTASGGARMQEGMYSLMQMAKTSAAIRHYQSTGLPFICLATNPTTGGVSASFATLADIIIAEPRALIGFTGPRVIEQTIRQKLPKDFQSSELMLTHGQIDMVVTRKKLRLTLSQLVAFLAPKQVAYEKVRG